MDLDVRDDHPEDQVGFSNREDQRRVGAQNRTSASLVRRTAQSSAVEQSVPTYIPVFTSNTSGSQSLEQRYSSGQMIAGRP
jgi:hypothetical protein